MNQSTHEQKFFEALIGFSSPGWNIKLQNHLQPGQMELGSMRVHVYVVDTSTEWMAAAAMEKTAFEVSKSHAKALGMSPLDVADAAGQSISRLGKIQPTADDPYVVSCIQLTVAAISHTSTFQLVQPKGVDGHWLYLTYRMMDASTVARPVYLNPPAQSGFLSAAMLRAVIQKVVTQDTRQENAVVFQELRRGGGALIAPAFKLTG